jgi:hypothetical protein
VTTNVTTVSKHFYEIKILPIIKNLCLKGLHKGHVNLWGGGENAKQNCRFEKNGTIAIKKFWTLMSSCILKRPLCINNLNFDCVNFENECECQIYRENIQKVVKIRQME